MNTAADNPDSTDLQTTGWRSTMFLVCGVIALLIVGIVVAIIASRRPAATFPPDSAPGTVARYLRLLQDGKVDQAYGMTDISLGPETFPETRSDFHQQFDSWGQTSHRVTLLRTHVAGTSASVTVQIAAFNGNVLGGSDQTSEQTFTLMRRGKTWRITGPPYLYP